MDVRAFRALCAAGAIWADIARETGRDWRTVKKYLAAEAEPLPPTVKREPAPRLIAVFTDTIDDMLTREPRLQATVVPERLVRYRVSA